MAPLPPVVDEPQPQLQAQASTQCMVPDLTSVMGWELLLQITRHLDTDSRSSWRLVSKAARQAVFDSTKRLAPAPCSDRTDAIAAVLPQLVASCSGLKRLICSGLPCLPLGLSSTAGLLQLPPGLAALYISWTDVTDLSFITRCTSLKRLVAHDVPGWGGPQSRQLAAVLQQLPRLTALDIHNSPLAVDAAAHDVAAALRSLTGLQQLDIGGIGPGAVAALLPAVPHLGRLRALHLSRCGLGSQALLPAALQLPRLRQLRLDGNALQAADALRLAPALGQLRRLQVLALSSNQLSDQGVSALAPSIRQLTGLITLDLGYNGFGPAGIWALGPALLRLRRLEHLHLHVNDLGPAGAALLAPALQRLTGLQCLYLCCAGLGAEGVAALAPALQRLAVLWHLDLGHNALGPAGLQALLPGIQPLAALRWLHLGHNALDREGTLLFIAGIQQLPQLAKLEKLVILGDAALGDADAEFVQALAHALHASNPGCELS